MSGKGAGGESDNIMILVIAFLQRRYTDLASRPTIPFFDDIVL